MTIHYTERVGSLLATELSAWILITLSGAAGGIYNFTNLLPPNAPIAIMRDVCKDLPSPPEPLNYSNIILATVRRYGILSEYYQKALHSKGLIRLIYAYAAWAYVLNKLGFTHYVSWAAIPSSHKLLRCLAFIYENDTVLVYALMKASKFTKPLNGTLKPNLNLLRAFIAYEKYYKRGMLSLIPKLLSPPCKDVWPTVLLAVVSQEPLSCSLKLGYSLRSVGNRSENG